MGEKIVTLKCGKCGKIIQVPLQEASVSGLCRSCKILENEEFDKVREYLYENGASTAIEIEEATGIPVKIVEKWLRQGRLEVPSDSPIFIKC